MGAFRFFTAGESHGQALVAIVEGVPAGVPIARSEIDKELARRQQGYGRGARMRIERDRVQLLSGVRFGKSLGSPIALQIDNRDWENWRGRMSPDPRPDGQLPPDAGERGGGGNPLYTTTHGGPVTKPRPGHADLAGSLKYGHDDLRNVLERASARETAARVAVGAVAKQLLTEVGIELIGHVVEIGGERSDRLPDGWEALAEAAERSEVRCADPEASDRMIAAIRRCKESGDTAGGVFEVIARGVPAGLGSHAQWDRKLDGRLGQALLSIQAIKGVEVGLGFEAAGRRGSEVHDEIFYRSPNADDHDREAPARPGRGAERLKLSEGPGIARLSNRAGGIEGGISNGEPVWVRAAMKPISTLYKPLRSVDLATMEPYEASVERSDHCAVPAAAVVGEAMVAIVLADAVLEKFGGDSLEELARNVDGFRRSLQDRKLRVRDRKPR